MDNASKGRTVALCVGPRESRPVRHGLILPARRPVQALLRVGVVVIRVDAISRDIVSRYRVSPHSSLVLGFPVDVHSLVIADCTESEYLTGCHAPRKVLMPQFNQRVGVVLHQKCVFSRQLHAVFNPVFGPEVLFPDGDAPHTDIMSVQEKRRNIFSTL